MRSVRPRKSKLAVKMVDDGPVELATALRQAFTAAGVQVVSLSRHGPLRQQVLFQVESGGYWTVQSTAPRALQGGPAEALEDWLYADLVDVQLPAKLDAIRRGRP